MKSPSDAAETWTPVRPDRLDLVGRVTDQLREKIFTGVYLTGASLPSESGLAALLGVSRPVIREAMRILSAQGLVEVSQGRRARVRSADPAASIDTLSGLFRRSNATLLDLIEARRVVEGEVAALAAQRAGDDDLRALEEACRILKSSPGPDAAVEADVAFHVRLAQATGNPYFLLLMQTLRALMVESVRKTSTRCEPGVHEPILAAIRARDPEKARQVMLDHLQATERLLKDNGEAPRVP